jgi:hypothetical protein
MSGEQNQPPGTTPAAEATQRLRAAHFTPLQAESSVRTPHGQRWQNRHGKVVYIDFTDDTQQQVWTASLDLALKEENTIPAHPWSPWWHALLGNKFRPS